jgi:hypothetical protein
VDAHHVTVQSGMEIDAGSFPLGGSGDLNSIELYYEFGGGTLTAEIYGRNFSK